MIAKYFKRDIKKDIKSNVWLAPDYSIWCRYYMHQRNLYFNCCYLSRIFSALYLLTYPIWSIGNYLANRGKMQIVGL